MIKTQLTYNLVHKWYTSENISVIGSAFLKNELLKEKNLSAYFQSANDEISFVPIVMEVGDIGIKKGWKEIDCTGKTFISARKFPKLDADVDFKFE